MHASLGEVRSRGERLEERTVLDGTGGTLVTLVASQTEVAEGGSTSLVFERSDSAGELIVYFERNEISTAGTNDVVETLPGSVTFPSGQTTAQLTLNIADDVEIEGLESLIFNLAYYSGGPVDYLIGDPGSATISIAASDVPPNEPPVGTPLANIYRPANVWDVQYIPLRDYFSDADHPDEELTFSVIHASGPLIYNYVDPPTGELALSYIGDNVPGITEFAVRATDPAGAFDEETFFVYSVAVTGVQLERQLPNDSWVIVPESEVLWDDDHLRWTAECSPGPLPIPASVEWLKTPAPAISYPNAPWTTFAQSSDTSAAEGNLTVGPWAITPKLNFAGQFAMLAAPVEKSVAKLLSVKWKQHDFGDGLNSYEATGAKFFAERRTPDPLGTVHNIIDIEVEIQWTDLGAGPAIVYLRAFDPDHDSSDPV